MEAWKWGSHQAIKIQSVFVTLLASKRKWAVSTEKMYDLRMEEKISDDCLFV